MLKNHAVFNTNQFVEYANSINLNEITNNHKIPFYMYDTTIIKNQIHNLYSCITYPRMKLFYAMKANYNPGVLMTMRDAGVGLDTVSPTEVLLALKLGFNPQEIIFTSNNMTDEEMHQIYQTGVLFTIDSLSRLDKFGQTYPGSDVCLRFNTNVVAGEHELIRTCGNQTKFGLAFNQLSEIKQILNRYNLRVIGLHEHTGSGIAEEDKVYESMENLLTIATESNFRHLRFIDFGGGFKAPYHPDEQRIDYIKFGQKITTIFENFCKTYNRDLELYFEPGKYLTAESGIFITRVNTLKENNNRRFAGVNSGFPHLIRPVLYDAYHHIINISNPNGPLLSYDVCGNICETGDRFCKDRLIPEIREGDYLVILNAGAYCKAMASEYNLRAIPGEIVIVDGEVKYAKEAETSEQLTARILEGYL